jgi:LAO/AO transport system kinase
MVDMFLLLLSPGGGDELQGIKRGIMELADLVIVNKADGDLEPAARRAQAEYRAALHIMRPKTPNWIPHALRVSALKGFGLDDVWAQIEKFRDSLTPTGEIADLRSRQAKAWMWSEINDRLMDAVREANPDLVQAAEAAVTAGHEPPGVAAERILARFMQSKAE